MQYALIKNGIVTDMVLWDGNTDTWKPPVGTLTLAEDQAPGITAGWTYLNGIASAPVVVPAPVLPAPTPTVITMRQARLALLAAGLLDTVDASIALLPRTAQIEWEYAQDVQRDNPLIGMLAAGLGLNTAALDALFVAGAAL